VNFADGSIADSGAPTTATFTHSVTFNSPGTFTYVCDIHVGFGMTGSVTVDS
jgi:plastocyanin